MQSLFDENILANAAHPLGPLVDHADWQLKQAEHDRARREIVADEVRRQARQDVIHARNRAETLADIEDQRVEGLTAEARRKNAAVDARNWGIALAVGEGVPENPGEWTLADQKKALKIGSDKIKRFHKARQSAMTEILDNAKPDQIDKAQMEAEAVRDTISDAGLNVSVFTPAIQALLNDPATRPKTFAEMRKFFRKESDAQKVADKYDEILNRSVANHIELLKTGQRGGSPELRAALSRYDPANEAYQALVGAYKTHAPGMLADAFGELGVEPPAGPAKPGVAALTQPGGEEDAVFGLPGGKVQGPNEGTGEGVDRTLGRYGYLNTAWDWLARMSARRAAAPSQPPPAPGTTPSMAVPAGSPLPTPFMSKMFAPVPFSPGAEIFDEPGPNLDELNSRNLLPLSMQGAAGFPGAPAIGPLDFPRDEVAPPEPLQSEPGALTRAQWAMQPQAQQQMPEQSETEVQMFLRRVSQMFGDDAPALLKQAQQIATRRGIPPAEQERVFRAALDGEPESYQKVARDLQAVRVINRTGRVGYSDVPVGIRRVLPMAAALPGEEEAFRESRALSRPTRNPGEYPRVPSLFD